MDTSGGKNPSLLINLLYSILIVRYCIIISHPILRSFYYSGYQQLRSLINLLYEFLHYTKHLPFKVKLFVNIFNFTQFLIWAAHTNFLQAVRQTDCEASGHSKALGRLFWLRDKNTFHSTLLHSKNKQKREKKVFYYVDTLKKPI